MSDNNQKLFDPQSNEFKELAADVLRLCKRKLYIATYATQKVKRTGSSTTLKVRIIAVTHLDSDSQCHLAIIKPAHSHGKEAAALKGRYQYFSGILRSSTRSGTQIDVRPSSDEHFALTMPTEAERDLFIAMCEKNFKGRRGTMGTGIRIASVDPSPQRHDSERRASEAVEEAASLLSKDDDAALRVIMDKYEIASAASPVRAQDGPHFSGAASPLIKTTHDARLLRERIGHMSKDLQAANESAILDSEKKWSEIVDSFETMALELSNVQLRLMDVTNKVGKRSDKIDTVERERAVREQRKKNYNALIRELNYVNDRIADVAGHVTMLDNASFEVGERASLHTALEFFDEFAAEQLDKDYDIRALHDAKKSIDEARARAAERLVVYLEQSFKHSGSRLKASSARKKGQLTWKTHATSHAKWIELSGMMPFVQRLGMRKVVELCRVYTQSMKTPYRQEIANYYKELKSQLQKKKHKPTFYIGQDLKDIKGLELLDVQLGTSQAGSTRYGGSDSGTVLSVGKSSNGSDDCEGAPSRLEQLGVVVYSERNAFGSESGFSPLDRTSVGSGSRGSDPRSRSSYQHSDDAVSVTHTHKTASGEKEKLCPHSALIASVVMSVEVMLGEQEFLHSLFGLNATPGSDDDLVRILDELFCDEKNFGSTTSLHIIVSELSRTVAYMHSKCDMLALLPVSIVVAQLQEAMETRSTFINDFLKHTQQEVATQTLVWQCKQQAAIQKFSCDIKHCVILPAYVRFPVFIKRLEEMCRPLPREASYSKIQDIISELYKLMRENLVKMVTKDKKYGDFFYYKNAAYHLDYLRDVRNGNNFLVKKLLAGQLSEFDSWVTVRDERCQAYIQEALLQDSFKSLFEFVEGVQVCLRSRSVAEVPLQQRFSRQNAQSVLSSTKMKHVKAHIDTVFKRLHKHFFEHSSTRKMDSFLRSLYPVTLEALKHHVVSRWVMLEGQLQSCYQGLQVDCTSKQLKEVLAACSPPVQARGLEFLPPGPQSSFARGLPPTPRG